ncbi:MAG: glycogen debranching protein, partial [Lentisphaerae bacterium]|nr:glycogen debranching protein [Lentisphaerota bacterium]
MLQQRISPAKVLFFTGETVTFHLSGVPEKAGKVLLRTNICGGKAKISEEINKTETGRMPENSDWHDFDMHNCGSGCFEITLPLVEIGIFEAKCCFLPADGSPALWAQGDNFTIKVTANSNIDGNGIYCCFVRQWGKWMHLPVSPEQPDFTILDQQGFTIVPPSGTFRSVIANLDHIFNTLNCRILQLLPIHPTPMAYGRMGRFGSPFAATDYFSVDPALAEFDPHATPMEQFTELIDAVHARCGRIFMDLPVNHTGWASKLQNEHPEYFIRDENRRFVSPGAWGVVWADLCQLDYSKPQVRDLMAKVFLFWCRHGVDGFRCDAGYMVPPEAWEYIIAKVRNEYPDTTFLLEGLGGPIPVQEQLLEKVGLDWGYSELFQNYTRDAISNYFPGMLSSVKRGGVLVNFAETHDNLRLASNGKTYAKLRFLVNALLSCGGTFGFANGAEFFATEKIDVHQCGALNFGAFDNLCTLAGKLNILLSTHPAFSCSADISLIQQGPGNVIAAIRKGENIPPLLILLNLDCENPAEVHFPLQPYESGKDLLTGRQIPMLNCDNGMQKVFLSAGEGICLSFDDFVIPEKLPLLTSQRIGLMVSAMAYKAAAAFVSPVQAAHCHPEKLCLDPVKFVENISGLSPAPITHWYYPQDSKRTVMAVPGDLLMLHSSAPFEAELHRGDINVCKTLCLKQSTGEFFALLTLPKHQKNLPEKFTVRLTVFETGRIVKTSGQLLLNANPEKRLIHLKKNWQECAGRIVFASNDRSSYAMFSACWGHLHSKYDAMLAVNNEKGFPADRYVLFSRCRAWLIVDGYSRELNRQNLESFCSHPDNRAQWVFRLPDGRGGKCTLQVEFRMAENADAIELKFHRKLRDDGITPDAKLILRPDLEDRVHHNLTKACNGAEFSFPGAVTARPDGFIFQPEKRKLSVSISSGKFICEPEWHYMIDLPFERYYGMDDKTDLFSPGYFSVPIQPGEDVILSASADIGAPAPMPNFPEAVFPETVKVEEIAVDALRRFVTERDGLSTVIAGYPWFLDWGRDTFIALRGLVKFPEFRTKAAEIIRRFAAFEKSGTIPNMICGSNDSNRDTSDAPLYLIVAVRDYIAASGDEKFLNTDCGGRPLKEILFSIINHYRQGTPNGIYMDQQSGLIFSPSHFSWMDTNYPAGTPRE